MELREAWIRIFPTRCRMRRVSFVLLLAGCVGLLASCDLEAWGDSTRYKDDFHQSYPLKAGGRLSVETFNGSVEVTGWDQETADISGTKYASTEDGLKALKVDIVTSGDSVRIRTVRPTDHRGGMGAKYVIKVPRQTSLERIESSNGAIRIDNIDASARLRTSNGGISVTGLKGTLEAITSNAAVDLRDVQGPAVVSTSNGSIQADEVSNGLEATTSNAAIHASLNNIEPKKSLKLTTSNGSVDLALDRLDGNEVEATTGNASITLHLPADVAVRLKAQTSNSSVTSEFDVTAKGTAGKNNLEGTINGGGPLVTLTTSNGSIRVLKKM